MLEWIGSKMNERIKQLANIWANRRAEDEKLGIVYTFSEPALEQFAELIIEECAHIAWLYDEPKLSGHGAIIANSIKKQFGVEE